MEELTDNIAPEGKSWVCLACGKVSKDKYGGATASPGWDVSCMLNSDLFDEDQLVYDETGKRVVMVAGDKEENV